MIERARKKNKASISEDDIATVLRRYSATTVLSLLKEVARFPDPKLDWKELVKNTATGISNAREYQMLWRHLAYQQTLLDKLEDRAEPLDDDSDLEHELAAFPLVSHEASAEAAACVKVMMESGSSDSGNPGCAMVEAPLSINIPNGHSSHAPFENSKAPCSMQGINITVPVCVQKQPIPALTSAEGLDACGTAGGNMPPRRKRKPWTEAEDADLIAAVQKYGEGNWANILKGDFKWDRTASQLSQRWAIRKKNGNTNVGGNQLSSSQLTEAQLAARDAVNHALNPRVKNITSSSSVGPAGAGVNATPSNSVHPNAGVGSIVQYGRQSQQAGTGLNSISGNSACPNAEASSSVQATHQSQPVGTGLKAASNNSVHPPLGEVGSVVQALHQSQQGPIPSISPSTGMLGLSLKSRLMAKKPSTKSIYNSDSMVVATAVAAGARIATQSVAESVIKAAKNVHIMPTGGGSLMKSTMSGGSTSHLAGHPNVHYICTGRAPTPHPTYPSITRSTPCSGPTKTAPPTIQHSSSISSMLPNSSSKQTNGIASGLLAVSHQQDAKTAEENKSTQMNNAPEGHVQKDDACVATAPNNNVPKQQVQRDGACVAETISKSVPIEQVQEDGACVADIPSNNAPKEQVQDHGACVADLSNNNAPKEQVQKDVAFVAGAPSNEVEEDKTVSPNEARLEEGTIVEDLLNSKTTASDKAVGVGKKAEGRQGSSQNSGRAEVIQDANKKKNKAEGSQDANQDKNKVEVCQDANQDKNRAEVSQDVHRDRYKDNKCQDANQDKNMVKECQDARQSIVMGCTSINAGEEENTAIANCKNEKLKDLLPSIATEEASEKLEVVSQAAVGSGV